MLVDSTGVVTAGHGNDPPVLHLTSPGLLHNHQFALHPVTFPTQPHGPHSCLAITSLLPVSMSVFLSVIIFQKHFLLQPLMSVVVKVNSENEVDVERQEIDQGKD